MQVLEKGGAETNSYFVFFSSQTDAAVAAQANLHPEDGHSFRVFEAPGPEEVKDTHKMSQNCVFGVVPGCDSSSEVIKPLSQMRVCAADMQTCAVLLSGTCTHAVS